MEVELGMRVASSGARTDVLVEAAPGTPFCSVRDLLLARVAAGGSAGAVRVDGEVLDARSLLGRPPLVHGALLEVGPPPARTDAVVHLRCIGGPDAGGRWALEAGRAEIGRGATAQVRVDDPLLSRDHCSLLVDGATGEVLVHDRGTTNGTALAGRPVGPSPVLFAPGAVLTVGSSSFALADPPTEAAPTRADGAGGILFNRPPRRRAVVDETGVHLPDPPRARDRRPLPVLAVLAPLALGVVLWRVLGSATFLLFTLLSPVLVLGSAVSDHRAGRRSDRREREHWRRETAEAMERLQAAVEREEESRRTGSPDPATVAETVRGPGERLWERRRTDDDVLAVALGRVDQPARVRVTGYAPTGAPTARGVPLVVSLPEVGVLGLAGGTNASRRALARWVVAQAAATHSPRDLTVVVLAAPAAVPAWEWARWLPHVRPPDGQACRALLGFDPAQAAARVAELRSLVTASASSPSSATAPRRVLLVVDGAQSLREVPGLVELLADGPAVGVHGLVVEDDRRLLPACCGAVAVMSGEHGEALELVVAGRPTTGEIRPDGVGVEWAQHVARALAPLRDAGRERASDAPLPATVSWDELVGLGLRGEERDVDAVVERWEAAGASTRAVLGIGENGPVAVDLVADGPHALVAGTTGSGKSELLQTWIASLALGNRPDALGLVLVDYKGGAAFGPCAGLPHVAGLVTDLDPELAARALASLRAELRRREAALASTGAKDVDEHRSRARPRDRLGRLVLVVDEFAALAEELPDFVSGLVDIAQRGRSLGVHLVLATQRPGGVVSADIRANTNLRLCLAVARDTDSRDVLDAPVAAHLSRTTPGRAFCRTGHAELLALQVARVSGRVARATSTPAAGVSLLPAVELGDPPPADPVFEHGDATELSALVAACVGASARLRLSRPLPPWRAPLPETLALADLPAYDDPLATHLGRVPPPAWGLLDLPEQQRQAPLLLDLDRATHLLVVGAPRSGRTTALRTLAGALAATARADDVHLHVVDAAGHGLAGLGALPHAGAVIARGQTEQLERLLSWLTAEVGRRSRSLAAAGHSDVAEQRAAADADHRLPHLVLLLDGLDAFLADHQERDAGRCVDTLHTLLRDGPAAGLHVVLTAGRAGLTGRLPALVDRRLVLRLADSADYALAGIADLGADPVPGRGWLLEGARSARAQVALLTPEPTGAAQSAALATLAQQCAPAVHGRGPQRFLPLPERVDRDALPTQAPSRGSVVLGAGGDHGGALVADLLPGFLVAGPAGSGRSTTLCTVAAALREQGVPLVAVVPRPSPLRDLAGPDRCVLDGTDSARLETLLALGPCALLVDDAELLVQSALAPTLERAVRQARDTGSLVVAAGTTDDLLLGYRGFVVDLRRSRRGLLLAPQGPADGDLLAVRTTRSTTTAFPPGRGLLCVRGTVEPVQVAV